MRKLVIHYQVSQMVGIHTICHWIQRNLDTAVSATILQMTTLTRLSSVQEALKELLTLAELK